ncbi:MAG: hypothetical protein WCY19_08650 [Candidatus Gastranaerophilaceae bacterium]
MKKNKLYFLIFGVVLFILIIFKSNFVEFVYTSPSLNTEVLPYISKTISKIDEGIDYAVKNTNPSGSKMQVLYKNAYGSGFLKHNPIPNDLDYSVGIHLGKYYYNGGNAKEIAKDMEDKMSTFEVEFYGYIYNQDKDLVSNYTSMSAIISLDRQKEAKINSMSYCLDKIFGNKDYIFYTIKDLGNNKKLKYPFPLKSDEILLENYAPLQLFTTKLKYGKDTTEFLREITIVLDFFADIENTQTKQVKHIEIVSESFVGQKFQLSRRFFVPIVFVGENSAKYLKNLDFLNDDNEYIEHRLLNFRRHLQEFSNLNEMHEAPVKMLKRILQCTELIGPVLGKNLKEEIYQTVSKNLENKNLQALNDYSTALGNLIQITQLPRLYFQADERTEIIQLLASMQNSLEKLRNNKQINQSDVISLLKFQKNIEREYSKIKTRKDLDNFSQNLLKQMEIYNKNITNIFDKLIQNRAELISYINLFDDIYTNAGFHKINLYWLNDNTLGISRDNFTNKINPSQIKKMALENDLPDVNYKLINPKQAPQITVRYSVWVKYNPTKQEEGNWQKLRRQLLEDKKNFKIKRKFIPKF